MNHKKRLEVLNRELARYEVRRATLYARIQQSYRDHDAEEELRQVQEMIKTIHMARQVARSAAPTRYHEVPKSGQPPRIRERF